jgi:hypothetical protein
MLAHFCCSPGPAAIVAPPIQLICRIGVVRPAHSAAHPPGLAGPGFAA